MGADLNLVFAEKGAAAVLRELAKLKAEARDAGKTMQAENQATERQIKMVQRAYANTLTPVQKLEAQAKQLAKAMANTKLPDLNRKQASDALDAVNAKIEETKAKLQATNEVAKDSDKQLDTSFGGKAVEKIARYALAFAAPATAISVVNKQLVENQRLVNEATKTQITIANSRRILNRNLPTDRATRDAFRGRVEELVAETDMSEAVVNVALAEAVSSADGDTSAALSATRNSLLYLPDDPSAAGRFAGTLLDLAGTTGTKDADINLGYLKQTAAAARLADAKAVATSLPKAVQGLSNAGLSAREASALFSATTIALKDTTGEISGEASVALAEKLKAYTGNETTDLSGMTPIEKLRRLQQDRALAEEFYGQGEGFGTTKKGVIRNLLFDSQSDFSQSFERNLRSLPGGQALQQVGRDAIAAINDGVLEARETAKRKVMKAVEQQQVEASVTDLDDDERKAIYDTLQKAGTPWIGAAANIKFAAGIDGVLQRTEATRLLESEIESRQKLGFYTPEEGQAIRGQVETLQGMLEEIKAGNELIRKQTQAIEDSAGLPTSVQ